MLYADVQVINAESVGEPLLEVETLKLRMYKGLCVNMRDEVCCLARRLGLLEKSGKHPRAHCQEQVSMQ